MELDLIRLYESEQKNYYDKTYPEFMKNNLDEPMDGNTILTTSMDLLIKYILFKHHPEYDFENEKLKFNKMSNQIFSENGFMNRGPHKINGSGVFDDDYQNHDDEIGWFAAASVFNPQRARIYRDHLQSHGWTANNNESTLLRAIFNSQRWRFAGYTYHADLCAGDHPSIWSQIAWCLSLVSAAFQGKNEASGRRMDLCKIWAQELSKQQFWLSKKAIEFWKRDCEKKYPNKIGDIFQVYHQRDDELKQEAKHIHAKWMRNVI